MREQRRVPDTEPVTLINVFEIPAELATAFIEGWTERARMMSTKPGFRDTKLHRALSPEGRFQLINVARWDNLEAYQAAHTDPEFRASINAVLRERRVIANPQLYRVVAGYTIQPGTSERVQIGQDPAAGQ